MKKSILIDTSGFFAFLNKADGYHEQAREKFDPKKSLTTNYIFDELMTLLTARGQKERSISFGEELRSNGHMPIHYLTPKEEEKAWQLYKKFRDHPLSFTDCTSLVVLREHHILSLLSFDEDLFKIAQSFIYT